MKSSLKRFFVFCSFFSLLFVFVSGAGADAAKDKLAYAQKSYEDLQKSEKRKSYKSLWLDVIKQFESVVRNYPDTEEGAKALFTEGVIYREMFNYSITLGELYKSEKTFKRFLREYPKHPLCADAQKNINEIKEQKEKNNLIRVSTVKPDPNGFPGRDKALAKDDKEEKPKKRVNKYLAKKEDSTPPQKPDKTEVAKVETPPPKIEEPVKTKTVKHQAPPDKEEPPKMDVAKVELPETSGDEDSAIEESSVIDSGTGGDFVAENDPSLPTGWESNENVKLASAEPPNERKEVVVDENPPVKTETASGAPHESRPNRSTADLPPPPQALPQPQPIAEVMTIRFFSDTDHTRIVVDTDSGITYKGASLPEDNDVGVGPRIYIDLFDTRLSPGLDSPITIGDGLVERIRWSQNREKIVRVVLDLDIAAEYNVFSLKNPDRVVIDVLRN
ncbi:MAG: AMIN domain-containing protein [Deltaproteobacteria bacterium]|uniref:AMIN domain-containing protein n=1 Tax=Candidatus Zymogenus saltonus TaxID=2844893 RepID=A0A9D8PMR7_9DELT|nr:AMIN domain-containing protein [Candidatus Zymogenus saltonus]